MPARVNNELVMKAAEALVEVAESMTNERGLRIRCPLNLHQAQGAVLATMVNALGYPHSVAPTGWTEISSFGEQSNGA